VVNPFAGGVLASSRARVKPYGVYYGTLWRILGVHTVKTPR
jgi:hypothetical protein